MANTAQAKKRARQNDSKRLHNASLKSTLRTAIKKSVTQFFLVIKKSQKKCLMRTYQLLTESLIKKLFIKIKQRDTNQDSIVQ